MESKKSILQNYYDYQNSDFKSFEGKLLVASPHLSNPYFERTLVYICAHDANGAIGIIINQQIGMISANDLIQSYKNYTACNIENSNSKKQTKTEKKFPLIFGGPANSEKTIAITANQHCKQLFMGYQQINLHINVSKLFHDIVFNKAKPYKLLLVKGISAWDPMHLEEEIAGNNWFVTDASVEMIFSQRIKYKWAAVIRNLGMENFSNLVQYSGNA